MQNENNQNQKIVISSYNDNEKIELIPEDLLFIRAEGNYINIFYLNKNVLSKRLLRNTLKNITELLKPFNKIIQTHRAYFVNLNNVVNVTGNSQGLILEMRIKDIEVPVSRNYVKKVQEAFKINT